MTVVHLSSVIGEGEGAARGKAGSLVIARTGGIKWTKKTIVIRNVPYPFGPPHDRRAGRRYLFGAVGVWTKGAKGKVALPYDGHKIPKGTTVPKPTAVIQAFLKGNVNNYISEKDFPKYQGRPAYHVHGYGMLKADLEKKGYHLPEISKEAVQAAASKAGISL